MSTAAAPDKRQHGTPFVDMAQLKLRKELVVVAQCLFAACWYCAYGREK
jgi:hypothetical protein